MKHTALALAMLLVSATAASAEGPRQPLAANEGARGSTVVQNDFWVSTQDRERRRDERRRGIGAILYSNPDLRGERYIIEGEYMRNLGNTGFNDRAQSLQVERGYWIFCSDAEFQGTCRTFGPGEYRRLPRGLDNRISSGRRISENYPYQGRPNWERR
ncbi:MAG TPA: beta/gamma crystallin-related protein [Casimicrobiaceae bacterium]|nr:beta/gamma crystallin-related protein [Casimicrobiaceae bacterium]